MIFSERRGAAVAAGAARQSPGGADTIATYDEGAAAAAAGYSRWVYLFC
jgi:hypothetical protein